MKRNKKEIIIKRRIKRRKPKKQTHNKMI